MNDGEKQELLIKIYLTYLRDNKIKTEEFGIIKSLGFDNEYKEIEDKNLNFTEIQDDLNKIKDITKKLEIQKSKPSDKADIKINKISYSLKCTGFSMPAIVNHTNREGWLKIAERKKIDITELDKIIEKYGLNDDEQYTVAHYNQVLYLADVIHGLCNVIQDERNRVKEVKEDFERLVFDIKKL
jgi:hypothetical protein